MHRALRQPGWFGTVMVCLLPGLGHAMEWPGHLGARGDGISLVTGIHKQWDTSPPICLWRVPMEGGGYSGPAAAQGRVFIVDRRGPDDVLRALDLRDGDTVWEFVFREPAPSPMGFAHATPVVDEDRVYVLGRSGRLYALAFDDGRELWRRDLVRDFGGRPPRWRYTMSPLVDGERLVVTPGGEQGAVAALNKYTGALIWQGGGSDPAGYATPVAAILLGRPQYVVFTAQSVIGVDAADGDLLWRHEWRSPRDANAAVPLMLDDRVFVSSGLRRGGAMIQILGGGTELLWENIEMQTHFHSALYYRDAIWGVSDPGNLVCLDPETGRRYWRKRGFYKGSLIIADDVLLVLDGESGSMVMVDACRDGYRELGRFQPLGGRSWTAPILVDGRLIVRNQEEIACFNVR